MRYVKYKGLTDATLTNDKVYEVNAFKQDQFTIINDLCRTMWFTFNSLFEDVTLEYSRMETIDEILK